VIASTKSQGLGPLSVTQAEEGRDDRPPPPPPARPTSRRRLVQAEGGSSANATPAANLAVGGVGRAGGGGGGGGVGVGGTNDNKGRRSEGWHDVLWRSTSGSRDAAAVERCHLGPFSTYHTM
jgi:hypothetical protein